MSWRGEMEQNKQEMIPQQTEDNNPAPKQTSPVRMTSKSRDTEDFNTNRRFDLFSIQAQRVILEIPLRILKSEDMKLAEEVAAQKRLVEHLTHIAQRGNYIHEEFTKNSEMKSLVTRTTIETEKQAKQEKSAVIKKLTDSIRTIKSELAETEEVQNEYKRYTSLFKICSLERQEAKEATVSHTETQESESTGLESSQGRALPCTSEPTPSAHDDRQVTNTELDCQSSEDEAKLELYFSKLRQVVDLRRELTDQILSQIHHSAKVDKVLEEHLQNIETSLKKIQENEKKIVLQVDNRKDRINKEMDRAAKLKKKVLLHSSLETKEQDVLLDDVDLMVTEVYRCCVEKKTTNFSTVDKLSKIEFHMSSLLQLIDSLPEESLGALKKIKDAERAGRVLEEQQRLEREKQRERMKKCMDRSLGISKKISGRKLMPRSFPVKQKVQVSNEDGTAAEDELQGYLFTTEDAE